MVFDENVDAAIVKEKVNVDVDTELFSKLFQAKVIQTRVINPEWHTYTLEPNWILKYQLAENSDDGKVAYQSLS